MVYRKLSMTNSLVDILLANMVFGQPALIEALMAAIVSPTMDETKVLADHVKYLNDDVKEQVLADVAKADFKVRAFTKMYDSLKKLRNAEPQDIMLVEQLESLPNFADELVKCARTQFHIGEPQLGLAIMRVVLDVLDELCESMSDSSTMAYMHLPMETWRTTLSAHAEYDPGKNFWKRGESNE